MPFAPGVSCYSTPLEKEILTWTKKKNTPPQPTPSQNIHRGETPICMKGCRWTLANPRADSTVTSTRVLGFPHYKWFKQTRGEQTRKRRLEHSRPYGKLCTGAVQKCSCHPPSAPTSQDKNNGGEESCVLYCNFSAVSLSLTHTPFQDNCFKS